MSSIQRMSWIHVTGQHTLVVYVVLSVSPQLSLFVEIEDPKPASIILSQDTITSTIQLYCKAHYYDFPRLRDTHFERSTLRLPVSQ